jgi:flagellar basal body-associated protein FliL
MPEQTPVPNEDPAAAIEDLAAVVRSPSIFARIRIFLFVVIVIVVECLVAYLYLPSASETAVLASGTLTTDPKTDAWLDEDGQQDEQELIDQVEVDLGEFSVTAFQPVSNTTLRIDFHLFGTVNAEDENTFLTLMEENLHRFREQVIVTVRSADITDLTDAGLGLIKRKILEKTNKTLGQPLLRVVIFSDFSFIEQ